MHQLQRAKKRALEKENKKSDRLTLDNRNSLGKLGSQRGTKRSKNYQSACNSIERESKSVTKSKRSHS